MDAMGYHIPGSSRNHGLSKIANKALRAVRQLLRRSFMELFLSILLMIRFCYDAHSRFVCQPFHDDMREPTSIFLRPRRFTLSWAKSLVFLLCFATTVQAV